MLTSTQSVFRSTFLTPIKAFRRSYIPLLLVYFAYGFQAVTSVALTFWEKESLGLTVPQLATLGVWVGLPWTLKMVFGQWVDNVALFGSRRKSYLVLGSFFLTLGYLVLIGLMTQSPWVMWMGSNYTIYLLASLLSVFGFLIQDVTADALSTELVDRYDRKIIGIKVKKTDAVIKRELALVQVWGRLSLMFAGVLAAFFSGYLAEIFQEEPYRVVLLALVIPIISLSGVFLIEWKEEPLSEKTSFHKGIIGGGVLYTAVILFFAFVGSWSQNVSGLAGDFLGILTLYGQEITVLFSFCMLFLMLKWLLKDEKKDTIRQIFCVLLALFCFRVAPLTGPGFSWWAIDVLGFDRAFFGTLKIIAAIIPLFLLWFSSDFITQKPIRTVLVLLVWAGALFSLPELGLYYGVHEALGLSPYFIAIADTVLESPILHIAMIPMLSMIAFYAPAHMRATWFALAASFMNLALSVGSLLTKYMNQIFVVSQAVVDEAGNIIQPADYSALGTLMIVKILIGIVIPLFGIYVFLKKK